MKQEDKDLLLHDLCGRLPYKVKIQGINPDSKVVIEELFSIGVGEVIDCNMIILSDVKPYLFPFSSMTAEQKEEERSIKEELYYSFDANGNIYTLQDFYNKNHIDYRGLIPKGLALDATELNIYNI